MPRLERLPTGVWTTRLSLTDPDTGRRTQPRLYAPTKRALEAEVARVLHQHATEGSADPVQTTVGVWVDDWLATYRASEATQYLKRGMYQRHIAIDPIADIAVSSLRPHHVEAFVARKLDAGYEVVYVRQMVQLLRMALRRPIARRVIRVDPFADLEYPSSTRRQRTVWSAQQVARFLESVRDDDLHALYVLTLTLGLRMGELIALRWNDVDLAGARLSVSRTLTRRRVEGQPNRAAWTIGEIGKTAAARRTLPLPPPVLSALRRHQERTRQRTLQSVYVFAREDGAFLMPNTLRKHWYAALARVSDLPTMRFHDCRHTAATTMILSGVPIPAVAALLGHSKPSITMATYAHLIGALHDQTVAVLGAMYDVSEGQCASGVPAAE